MSHASQQQTTATAAAAPTTNQSVFELHGCVQYAIQALLLPKVKETLKEINNQCVLVSRTNMSGNKAVLVERLHGVFDRFKSDANAVEYTKALRILERHFGKPINTNTCRPYNAPRFVPPPYQHTPYLPAVQLSNGHVAHASTSSHQGAAHPSVPHARPTFQVGTFQPSPFYTVKEQVGNPVVCYPMTSRPPPGKISFVLSAAQKADLLSNPTTLQLRLFCTTVTASRASLSGKHPAPVEFPLLCDIRVNREKLSVNVRSKKTPAKVLPPNVNKDGRLNLVSGINEVELVYSDTRVAYPLSLAICEMVTSDTLASRVISDHIKSKEAVLSEMKRAAEDDEIEVGEVTITLKCPLSYMRLVNPCRSSVCVHVQCFDVLSFFSVNEQTPSWECPVCSQKVDPNRLFIDGYVKDILQRVPESEEYVNIDADGKWRTPDSKYRSDASQQPEAESDGQEQKDPGDPMHDSANESQSQPRVKGEVNQNTELPDPAATATSPSTPSKLTASTSSASNRQRKEVTVYDLDDSPSPPRPTSDAMGGDQAMSSSSNATATWHSAVTNVNGNGSVDSIRPVTWSGPRAAPSSSPLPMQFTNSNRSAGVIDLTLEDSEEEGDLPLRQALPSSSLLASSNNRESSNNTGMGAAPVRASVPLAPRPPPPLSVSSNSSPYAHHVVQPPTQHAATHTVKQSGLERYLIAKQPSTSSVNQRDRSSAYDSRPYVHSPPAPLITPLMRNFTPDGREGDAHPAQGRTPQHPVNGADAARSAVSAQVADAQTSRRRSYSSDDGEGDTSASRANKRARNVEAEPSSTAQPEDDDDEFRDLEFFDDAFLLDPAAGLGGENGLQSGTMDVGPTPVPQQASSAAVDELSADERAGLTNPDV